MKREKWEDFSRDVFLYTVIWGTVAAIVMALVAGGIFLYRLI